jgi:retinol dehydrogenase-14
MDQLAGRRIVVTGGTHGIGLACAVQLARAGAKVVITGRDPGRLAHAAATVGAGGPPPETFVGDFASLASVRALAEALLRDGQPIHVLVNNAGSVFEARTTSVDGHESTWAVNHLAPFLLTNLLLERLVASAPARIVNVASGSHYRGTMDLADPGYANGGWSTMAAYERSKLANVLFTRALAKRLAGRGVTVNAVHPGTVATNIWSHAPGWIRPILNLGRRFMYTVEQGAEPLTRLASAADVAERSGAYFNRLEERRGAALSQDEALAERLWVESARVVGLP